MPKQKYSMFDEFPNDLFYEVFEYLSTFDILYAFKGLYQRLDALLTKYKKFNLDFQSWPKWKFDFICQSISPEQVRSLTLADADDTCRQIHKFFNLFYIRHFVNLRSLRLIDISEQDLNKLTTKFYFCSKLSSLTIRLAQGLIPPLNVPPLKFLSIGVCSISQLQLFLVSIPSLIYLHVQLIADSTPVKEISLLTTEIRQLTIKLAEKSNIEFKHIKTLFQYMQKLEKLTFIAVKGFQFVAGERWEQLISTYAPQLNEFHLKLHQNLDNTYPNPLLSTFQTPFWLNEKQWFIHYNNTSDLWIDYRHIRLVHFYTLPYSDEQFQLTLYTERLTNASKEEYSTIKNLYLILDYQDDHKLVGRYYFPHLQSLTILNLYKLIPLDNIMNFSHIKHLTLEQRNKPISSEEFFSYILTHTTQLQSLELSWQTLLEITKNFTHRQICASFKKQIKYLKLVDLVPNLEMLHKFFSKNLERLSLCINSIDNIPSLLNTMTKLSSVKIECNSFHSTMNDQEFLSWLTRNIPRLNNFTHQIRPTTENRVCLLLWIGR